MDSRTPEVLGLEGSRGRGVTSGGRADQWAVDSSSQGRALTDAVTSARVSALRGSARRRERRGSELWEVKSGFHSRSAGMENTWGGLDGAFGER